VWVGVDEAWIKLSTSRLLFIDPCDRMSIICRFKPRLISDMSEALLDCGALAALLGISAATVQANASRSPDLLPPRAPGRLLRWHPDAYRTWAMEGRATPRRRGRPRTPATL
jgi:hypothetical protein